MLDDFLEIENNLSTNNLKVKSFSVQSFDLHALQELNKDVFPFLLESVAVSQAQPDYGISQFSILFAYPQENIRLNGLLHAKKFQQEFQQSFVKTKQSVEVGLPFTGGWFCYFSYDYAQVIEPSLSFEQSNLPLVILTRVPCAFIYDNKNKQLHLVAEDGFEDNLSTMQTYLKKLKKVSNPVMTKDINISKITEEAEEKYLLGLDKIKEYILSGDIFQVNLSRQWQVEISTDKTNKIYELLRQKNPAPFAANIYFKELQIISSSPERLVKYDAKTSWVETRPIAGTRQRSACVKEDKTLVEELLSHPKEIAEHIMLIDLERNDLGRICQVGSVEVNELMSIETYQHVHHIVSNIRGKLKDDTSPLDIIHAVFPGGTITGCPKIRCMQIIAELEKMPRDAYTGSIGYINRDGSLDTNILIRTIVLQDNIASFRAGAGIVADSVATNELEETRHKAKGLIEALGGIN